MHFFQSLLISWVSECNRVGLCDNSQGLKLSLSGQYSIWCDILNDYQEKFCAVVI